MGTTHEQVNIILGDVQIGNPAETLNLGKGYPAILIRLVERGIIDDIFFLVFDEH